MIRHQAAPQQRCATGTGQATRDRAAALCHGHRSGLRPEGAIPRVPRARYRQRAIGDGRTPTSTHGRTGDRHWLGRWSPYRARFCEASIGAG